MKVSAFPIYRFFRNELSALTKAALVCIVALGALAFVFFSPVISFVPAHVPAARCASVGIAESYAETGIFQDTEPLFLPTRRNFGESESPEELALRESSFLPFGEMLSLGTRAAAPAMALKHRQIPPTAAEALGADAWRIARGFGAGGFPVPAVAGTPKSSLRIENAETGEVVFSGELEGADGDDAQTLLSPAEFFCGIAVGYGSPRVLTVASCGDVERDARIRSAVAEILRAVRPGVGVYRIFADLR